MMNKKKSGWGNHIHTEDIFRNPVQNYSKVAKKI